MRSFEDDPADDVVDELSRRHARWREGGALYDDDEGDAGSGEMRFPGGQGLPPILDDAKTGLVEEFDRRLQALRHKIEADESLPRTLFREVGALSVRNRTARFSIVVEDAVWAGLDDAARSRVVKRTAGLLQDVLKYQPEGRLEVLAHATFTDNRGEVASFLVDPRAKSWRVSQQGQT